MYSAEEFKELVEKSLKGLKFPDSPAELYSPITYSLSMGGKRIRPILSLLACNMFTDRIGDRCILPAVGLEMFHGFTLIHDDIMDKSDLRRNQPTVHKKWNTNIAILSGDTMCIEAYKLLCMAEPDKIVDILHCFNRAATDVCEGQQMDMNYESRTTITEEDYLLMIELKTAVLLAVSAKIGAIMGGANTSDIERLYRLGLNLGLAFQIQDDIMDTYSDSKTFGKAIGLDIENNKKTYLLTSAIRLAKGDQKKILREVIEGKVVENKVETVKAIYKDLSVKELAENKVKGYFEAAMSELSQLDIKAERKQNLESFCNKILTRIN